MHLSVLAAVAFCQESDMLVQSVRVLHRSKALMSANRPEHGSVVRRRCVGRHPPGCERGPSVVGSQFGFPLLLQDRHHELVVKPPPKPRSSSQPAFLTEASLEIGPDGASVLGEDVERN